MTAVKIIDHGWNRIKKELKLIDKSYTQIGVQSDAGDEDNGKSIASVASDNEYGVVKFGRTFIPPRPFMRTSFDENRAPLNRLIAKQYSNVLKGTRTVKQGLALIGEYMEGTVKKKITDIRTPKNADYTIAKKKSSNPLIDTGRMRASIRHVEVITK